MVLRNSVRGGTWRGSVGSEWILAELTGNLWPNFLGLDLKVFRGIFSVSKKVFDQKVLPKRGLNFL